MPSFIIGSEKFWLVSLLRAELARATDQFPILLTKVVYDGSHGGDHLPLSEVYSLREELKRLKEYRCVGNEPKGWLRKLARRHFGLKSIHFTSEREAQRLMEIFRAQMEELAGTAIRAKKPILF